MKKMIFGVALFMGGLIGVLDFISLAVINPGSMYIDLNNSIGGILPSMTVNGTLLPFLLFLIMGITGLVICLQETQIIKEIIAARKSKQ